MLGLRSPPTSLLLDPHRLDSEGVLPLPSASSVGGASHARKKKWTSTSSMDLEWEVEGKESRKQ